MRNPQDETRVYPLRYYIEKDSYKHLSIFFLMGGKTML